MYPSANDAWDSGIGERHVVCVHFVSYTSNVESVLCNLILLDREKGVVMCVFSAHVKYLNFD